MTPNYKETHKTWNKVAPLYEAKFMDLELYNDTYERFCELIPKFNASILELGCGPGNITRHLNHLRPDFKILATDVSQNMIELAEKNIPGIETKVLDCRNLGVIKEVYDGLVCGFTIPYLSKLDTNDLIVESAKLLNAGGILYLSFVTGDYNQSGFIAGSTGDRTHFYYHEFESIKDGLEKNKLAIVERSEKEYKRSESELETHTILIVKKGS